MASIGEALLIALDHHQSGRLSEAETLYRRILQADSAQPDALHLLGVLLGQAGHPDEAQHLIRRAIALAPGNPDYPLNLANTLRAHGRDAEAAAAYAQVCALSPANAEAAARLGTQWAARGEVRARTLVRGALAGGASAEALYGFAMVALDQGWDAEAAALLAAVLGLAPDAVVAHANLALLLHRTGDAARAIRHYAAALALRPEFPEMLGGLGTLTFTQRGEDRTAAARSAAWFDRARRFGPLDRDRAIQLSVALLSLRREAEVPAVLRPVIAADPQDALALFNLAQAHQNRDEGDVAAGLYRRILCLDPSQPDSLLGLGHVLTGLGFAADGLRWMERAVDLVPGRADWLRQLLMTVLYVPDLDAGRRFALHRRLDAFGPDRPAAPHLNRREPERRLRIGYVTSDLRAFQPVSRNMLPLYREHDRSRHAIHTYADVAEPDATTARFRALSDAWCDIGGMTDSALADRIRADGIDVLVVLAGRFDRNRVVVCQHRPAPVQVSFLDAATLGLSSLDAIITDRVMTPRRPAELFAERPLRLPGFYVADIPADAPPVVAPPSLADGIVRFGCFNNPAKISDGTLRLWARLLARVPRSRLVLKYIERYRNPSVRRRILDGLAGAGVAPERVEMIFDRVDTVPDHLAQYGRIDIAVDPFPFCGSTTTFEALCMGVPVVTLMQEVMVSRWCGSMLRTVGLSDCAVASEEEYLDRATALAADPDRLAALRAGLRGRLTASPLCDGRLRARQLERAYRALWRRWCRTGAAR